MTNRLKKLLRLAIVLVMIPAVASAKTVEVTDSISYIENAAGWVEIDNISEFNDWFRNTSEDSILRAASKAGKTVTAKLILNSDLALNVSAYVGTDDYPDAHNITIDMNGHTITAKNDGTYSLVGGVTIEKNPLSVWADNGEVATGDDLTYQWQYSKNGTNWYYTAMEGCKTAQLNVIATVARNGYQYRCVITDAYGNEAVSAEAVLTVE